MIPVRIIIHHSATEDSGTVSWGAIRKYHVETNGWKDIGYNFGIEDIGGHLEILIGRMPNEEGAHTIGQNIGSIGICVVGNFDIDPVTDKHKQYIQKLIRWLQLAYRIPFTELYGHRNFASYKSCPGENLYKFIQTLKEI